MLFCGEKEWREKVGELVSDVDWRGFRCCLGLGFWLGGYPE